MGKHFKNKQICKNALERLANGFYFGIEWQYVYYDVINLNMDLDASIQKRFRCPRGMANHVDWAYWELSQSYHALVSHYNIRKKMRLNNEKCKLKQPSIN